MDGSRVSRIVLFLLRVLTFVSLLVALILIATNKATTEDTPDNSSDSDYSWSWKPDNSRESDYSPEQIMFNGIHAFRYMLSTIVIGFAYNFLQMALSIITMVSGKRAISGDAGYLFDFFGDKIISFLLISGSAAGFGFSEDLNRIVKAMDSPLNSFFAKAIASASFLLVGFLCTAIASILTSFALPKKT